MNNAIKKVAENPSLIIVHLLGTKMFHWMPDDLFLKIVYRCRMGKKLDLDNPKSFNEKLQWLKIHDRKPVYTQMVDKLDAKLFIEEKLGKGFTIETLGVWNTFDEIDFERLPNQFVLKCTHDSGGLVICKDKNQFSKERARLKIERCLKRNFYWYGREWPYKNVKPRIIAEPYIVDESGWELKDYKIFCFNGKAEYVEVDFNRFVEHKLNPYDFDWNPLNFCDKSKNDYSASIKKPERLNEMREIAETLSQDMAFLRVDFYYVNGRILVGEMTLHPGSGFIAFDPENIDMYYGQKLTLPVLN